LQTRVLGVLAPEALAVRQALMMIPPPRHARAARNDVGLVAAAGAR